MDEVALYIKPAKTKEGFSCCIQKLRKKSGVDSMTKSMALTMCSKNFRKVTKTPNS